MMTYEELKAELTRVHTDYEKKYEHESRIIQDIHLRIDKRKQQHAGVISATRTACRMETERIRRQMEELQSQLSAAIDHAADMMAHEEALFSSDIATLKQERTAAENRRRQLQMETEALLCRMTQSPL